MNGHGPQSFKIVVMVRPWPGGGGGGGGGAARPRGPVLCAHACVCFGTLGSGGAHEFVAAGPRASHLLVVIRGL